MGQGNIIGYEINEKTCQISFYNEEMAALSLKSSNALRISSKEAYDASK